MATHTTQSGIKISQESPADTIVIEVPIVPQRSDFQENVVDELKAMFAVGIIGHDVMEKAIEIVDCDPDTYNDESGMSVSDAADLAIDLARIA